LDTEEFRRLLPGLSEWQTPNRYVGITVVLTLRELAEQDRVIQEVVDFIRRANPLRNRP